MNKFILNNNIEKSIIKTKYGYVSIKNIKFNPRELEDYLPILVLEDDNLYFMFQSNNTSDKMKYRILNRFIPPHNIEKIEDYVKDSLKNNRNFYSFLAEGILSLVFRDIYNYQLSFGIIDTSSTLNDTHSGADACMFDSKNNVLILGEAKFYEKFYNGIKSIIDDFCENNIINKLESFQKKSSENESSFEIVLKNLKKNTFEEITLEEFLKQKIIFAGFVLHSSSEYEIKNCLNYDFYDKFDISVHSLENNISKCLNKNFFNSNYEIILLHLPINSKKDLIKKIIEKANEKISILRGENKND